MAPFPVVILRGQVYLDETGSYQEMPALWTPYGWLEYLTDYFLEVASDRSTAWMMKVARAVSIFLEYVAANPEQQDPQRLFSDFAKSLYTGTFDRLTGIDPSWICREPMSPSEARQTVLRLRHFLLWLSSDCTGKGHLAPAAVTTAWDRMLAEKAYQFRRAEAFLGHSWSPDLKGTMKGFRGLPDEEVGVVTGARRSPYVSGQDPPAFPEEAFPKLLFEGFKVAGRLNYRDMLITLLLHGTGLRASEPFHLYFGDITEDPGDPGRALVLIHHPQWGIAPKDWRDTTGRRTGNRAAYLSAKYGLAPRNQLLDNRAAGWKGCALDAKHYMRAWWFHPEYGEWFLQIWKLYLQEVVNQVGNQLAHPFAWVNLAQPHVGGIYTLPQYHKAHSRACERIGLTVGKALGTTPHGHRHAYGRRLMGAKFERLEIKKYMHHRSLFSQDVYTMPTTAESLDELKNGLKRLEELRMVHG